MPNISLMTGCRFYLLFILHFLVCVLFVKLMHLDIVFTYIKQIPSDYFTRGCASINATQNDILDLINNRKYCANKL